MSFAELTSQEQIQSLIEPAHKVLLEYGIKESELENINHEYNSTFSVLTTEGVKYALRLNINSDRTEKNIAAEMTFVNYLANTREFKLAVPVKNLAGGFVSKASHKESGKELLGVLFTWLEGDDVGDEPSLEVVFKMGALLAGLHNATKDLDLPEGQELPVLDDFMWHVEDLLLGPKTTLSPEQQSKIAAAKTAIEGETEKLFDEGNLQLIHADLHGWNLKWHNEELSVFDFDDSGIGLPIQDLATTIYYLDTQEQISDLKKGYSSVRPLPPFSDYQMKALLLQRRIHLLNYIYETQNPEHRDLLPKYQEETFRRIEEFLAK